MDDQPELLPPHLAALRARQDLDRLQRDLDRAGGLLAPIAEQVARIRHRWDDTTDPR
jgi:hypothetical protein